MVKIHVSSKFWKNTMYFGWTGNFCWPTAVLHIHNVFVFATALDVGLNQSSMLGICGISSKLLFNFLTPCIFRSCVCFRCYDNWRYETVFLHVLYFFSKRLVYNSLFVSSSAFFCKWYGIGFAFCFIGEGPDFSYFLISVLLFVWQTWNTKMNCYQNLYFSDFFWSVRFVDLIGGIL